MAIGNSEGSVCGRGGCEGKMEYRRGGDGGCSCHISPPCSNCVESYLECADCGTEAEE